LEAAGGFLCLRPLTRVAPEMGAEQSGPEVGGVARKGGGRPANRRSRGDGCGATPSDWLQTHSVPQGSARLDDDDDDDGSSEASSSSGELQRAKAVVREASVTRQLPQGGGPVKGKGQGKGYHDFNALSLLRPGILHDRAETGVAFGSTPSTGWSSFTAQHARGRAHSALSTEVEYVLECIASLCDQGRVSMNVFCSSQERCDLLAQELRVRMFTVINPVRAHYEAKARRLLEMRARVVLPVLPSGAEGEEFLLRILYADPSQAEASYAGHVGTFKIDVDCSLDKGTERGQEYFFGTNAHLQQAQYKDSQLLLRVSW